ncbi:hypothetical protein [Planococcus shixiaomingii]|uniref:hypothetical protein n=1 Tax=Planococcus shixiaomingii TaxID=3058393 RepID=UPI00265B43F1|nr:hypothetical protein [Planococcus sp. N028]
MGKAKNIAPAQARRKGGAMNSWHHLGSRKKPRRTFVFLLRLARGRACAKKSLGMEQNSGAFRVKALLFCGILVVEKLRLT